MGSVVEPLATWIPATFPLPDTCVPPNRTSTKGATLGTGAVQRTPPPNVETSKLPLTLVPKTTSDSDLLDQSNCPTSDTPLPTGIPTSTFKPAGMLRLSLPPDRC